jgi:hypothetical protein
MAPHVLCFKAGHKIFHKIGGVGVVRQNCMADDRSKNDQSGVSDELKVPFGFKFSRNFQQLCF